MLQFIRDRAKGWFAWVIVTLITIPFALWGINQYFDLALPESSCCDCVVPRPGGGGPGGIIFPILT